jgi:hypothetical protein
MSAWTSVSTFSSAFRSVLPRSDVGTIAARPPSWIEATRGSGEGQSQRDSAQKVLNLDDLRSTFVHGNDAEEAALWDDIIEGQLPERVGRCVVGYDC